MFSIFIHILFDLLLSACIDASLGMELILRRHIFEKLRFNE